MQELLKFLLTVLIASLGGFLGKKLHFPGGLLVGAMVFVAAFHLLTGMGKFYSGVRVVLQIFSGAMVGSRIGKEELRDMKSLWKAVLVLIASMVLLDLAFATLLSLFAGLSFETSLFAAAPGSSQDMTIMSADFGADVGMVAILQVCRLILIYLFIPPLIRFLDRRETGQITEKKKAAAQREGLSVWRKSLFLMLLAGTAGGMILYFLKVNAGAMIGSMIGSTLYCVKLGKQRYPKLLKSVLQILSGAYVGMRLNREILSEPQKLLFPVLVMLFGIFAFTFLTSALIRRLAKTDRCTAMLASTPGGIQEMSLLSDELGADTPKVAVMHTARNMSVVLLFPLLIQALISLVDAFSD